MRAKKEEYLSDKQYFCDNITLIYIQQNPPLLGTNKEI